MGCTQQERLELQVLSGANCSWNQPGLTLSPLHCMLQLYVTAITSSPHMLQLYVSTVVVCPSCIMWSLHAASCLSTTSSERRQVLHSNASFVLCSTAELCVTAVLCAVAMWRVDWEEEAVEARKQSIAMQAERLLHSSSCDAPDVEQLGWGTAGLLPSR